MISIQEHHDDALRRQLEALTEADKDYWSFKGNSRREHGHGLFQYPAMMVPQVVEAVLTQVCAVHPDIERVGDPFVGSGTIMTESMMRGLAFSGTDINPLAILLCRVKRGPFFIASLKVKSELLKARIKNDRRLAVETSFPNIDKWFERDVQIGLSRLRRAIQHENALWARRFFWVVLAETVRLMSNSRTSTFKLHIRTQQDISTRAPDPVATFERVLDRNVLHYEEQAKRLAETDNLSSGNYKQEVVVSLGDIRLAKAKPELDIVITSPPYGDNATTVPYGQYSYLPLQWIDLEDIDPGVTSDYLVSTYEIDSRSLGGSKRLMKEDMERIADRSPAFRNYIRNINDQPQDRAQRVTAFFRDLDGCLDPILSSLRPGGLMVWILGNRKVGGKRVPLDRILSELLRTHRSTMLCKLSRRIPSKRMAPKNSVADTMSCESILVVRKAA